MNRPSSSLFGLFAFFLGSFCLGCGDSAKDIQNKRELLEVREKKMIDSTRLATQAFLEQRQRTIEDSARGALEMQKAATGAKLKKENETRRRESDKAILTNELQGQETELLIQQERFESLKKPRLLRTQTEKEQALRQQIENIQLLKASIVEIKEVLVLIDNGSLYEMPQSRKTLSL